MQRPNSTDWNVADPITAQRLNDFNLDLDVLFEEISNEDVSLTYDGAGKLTQIVDNENSITINIDWNDFTAAIPKLYIQKVGDTKKYTITYSGSGYAESIVYA